MGVVRKPSTADALFFLNENGSGFLVQASSAASGYRKPTHVTQESMATTYPGIAYEQQQQQQRRNCSQSQNTNYGKEKPSGVSVRDRFSLRETKRDIGFNISCFCGLFFLFYCVCSYL